MRPINKHEQSRENKMSKSACTYWDWKQFERTYIKHEKKRKGWFDDYLAPIHRKLFDTYNVDVAVMGQRWGPKRGEVVQNGGSGQNGGKLRYNT